MGSLCGEEEVWTLAGTRQAPSLMSHLMRAPSSSVPQRVKKPMTELASPRFQKTACRRYGAPLSPRKEGQYPAFLYRGCGKGIQDLPSLLRSVGPGAGHLPTSVPLPCICTN